MDTSVIGIVIVAAIIAVGFFLFNKKSDKVFPPPNPNPDSEDK